MILTLTTHTHEPGIIVIEIDGRLAIGRESSRLEAAVVRALEDGTRRIVLDLAQCASIDSTGIGIIAYCFGKASQAGALLHVAGASGRVREVFQITHLNEVIGFFSDVDSACKSLADSESNAEAASAT
jgi:anti-sigma B factor antagonist